MRQFFIPFLNLLLSLNEITEWKRLDGGKNTVLSSLLEEVSCLRELWSSLEVHLYTGLTGFSLGSLVGDLTGENLLLALRLTDVLDAYMDTLLDDASVYKLVHTYTYGGLGDVENNSGTSMVMLVWHTLVNGRVGENINVVTNLDVHQVLRKGGKSMLTELLGKHVPGTGAGSK